MRKAENEGGADENLSRKGPGHDAKFLMILCRELEANSFATRVVVPRWLVEWIAELDRPDVIELLEKPDVAVPVGLRALVQWLLPGFFVEHDDEDNVVRHWECGRYGSSLAVVSRIGKGQHVDF
ncbi:hypothetical protein [Arthrobacter sp. RAF14]|uniref:hypothetical protein n=1 Tax=Arthrobacter sp. RAF14 TaxID=3233051 RepID=UPI003F913A0D